MLNMRYLCAAAAAAVSVGVWGCSIVNTGYNIATYK